MAEKTKVDVLIAGRAYTIAGYESDEHISRVGLYVDRKLADIQKGSASLSTSAAAVLAAINVADDFFKARESELGIKKDLLAARIELERARQENAALEERNRELLERCGDMREELSKKDIEIAEIRGGMAATRQSRHS